MILSHQEIVKEQITTITVHLYLLIYTRHNTVYHTIYSTQYTKHTPDTSVYNNP